jgi:adenylate cyclase
MKYRTKLYLSFVGISVASTALALSIGYDRTKTYLFDEIKRRVVSIAGAAAASLDGDRLEKLQTRIEEGSPDYLKVQRQLRRIRDAARRAGSDVQYIYTLIPSPTDPHQILFQVDAEEDPNLFSHLGDINPDVNEDKLLGHWGEYYSSGEFTRDEWGQELTGYAPVYNSSGELVALVAVDLAGTAVMATLHELLIFAYWALAGSILLALIGASILSRRVTRSLHTLADGIREMGEGHLDYRVKLKTKDEFNDLAEAINRMAVGIQERERLKVNFARYVSQHVLDKILSSAAPLNLEGERKKLTLLFSDIRQFTHLSANLPPEDVVRILNEYFGAMLDVIFKYHGTLDKFLGDGIMVEFGAPLDDPMQEENAVRAALEMQETLVTLREKWKNEGKPLIEIGIGIHTGVAVVGNIGSEKRMEYTAIGDPVNIAARLEQMTKTLKTSILVSETTVEPIKDKFPFKSYGSVNLHEHPESIIVYGLE